MARNGRLFTATQEKILAVLADGMPHTREELRQCFDDGSGVLSNGTGRVRVELCKVRKILRPMGQDVICEFHARNLYYRHVRLLCGPGD
jgi:hypothetical protein